MTRVPRPFPTPEERLCVLLSYREPDPAEIARAHALARSIRSWDDVWTLADTNASAPQVYHNLRATGLAGALPPGVRPLFERRSEQVRAENELRLDAARRVLSRLVDRGIAVAVLKGAFFAETVYRNPHYKRMNDVDLLVQAQDLDAACDVYEACGLRPLGGGSERRRRRVLSSHHGPAYVTKDFSCVIDTQWGLVTPLRGFALDYIQIWSRVQEFAFCALPLKSLCPEDNLHHLCVHLDYFKTAVGDLADLYNLLRWAGPRFDWERFLDAVARAGTAGAVYHALALSNRLCPMVEVEEVLSCLRPAASRYDRCSARRKTERLTVLLRIGTPHMETVQRDFAALAASANARSKWGAFVRLWCDVLVPPPDDALRIGAYGGTERAAVLRARLTAPWRILRAVVAEIGVGWLAVWLVESGCALLRLRVRGRRPC